jgi:hypothetical protein
MLFFSMDYYFVRNLTHVCRKQGNEDGKFIILRWKAPHFVIHEFISESCYSWQSFTKLYAELTVILNKDNTLRIAHVQWRQKERLRHWRRQKERLIHWQIISGKIYLDWKATLNFYKNVPTSKCYIQLVSRTLDLFNLLRKLREARSKVHAYRRHLVDKTARLLYANMISRVAASPGGNAERNNAFCGQIHAAAVSQTNNHLFNE